jgi:hypothetical protein
MLIYYERKILLNGWPISADNHERTWWLLRSRMRCRFIVLAERTGTSATGRGSGEILWFSGVVSVKKGRRPGQVRRATPTPAVPGLQCMRRRDETRVVGMVGAGKGCRVTCRGMIGHVGWPPYPRRACCHVPCALVPCRPREAGKARPQELAYVGHFTNIEKTPVTAFKKDVIIKIVMLTLIKFIVNSINNYVSK